MAGLHRPGELWEQWSFTTMGCGCCSSDYDNPADIDLQLEGWESYLREQLLRIEEYRAWRKEARL